LKVLPTAVAISSMRPFRLPDNTRLARNDSVEVTQ